VYVVFFLYCRLFIFNTFPPYNNNMPYTSRNIYRGGYLGKNSTPFKRSIGPNRVPNTLAVGVGKLR